MIRSLLVVAALIIAGVAQCSETGTFEKTLAVTGEVDLDVSSGPGGVNISTGPAGVVRVRAVIRPLYGAADLGMAEATIRMLEQKPPVEQQGNAIRIGYVNDASALARVSVTYDIETPRESRCRVATSSGGVRIDNIVGPVKTESSSGRIEVGGIGKEVVVRNASGAVVVRRSEDRVSARTTSGTVQAVGIKGPVEVETTSGRTDLSDIAGHVTSQTNSGSIFVQEAASIAATNHSGSIDAHRIGGEIRVRTKSGAIRLSQAVPAPITARTDNGAVKVELKHGGSYDLDLQSDSGKVAGPVVAGPEHVAQARRLRGHLRGGGPLVDLDTKSSKIVVLD